ncbi:unnamed protein product, partial [Symbiodinium sp. KB8]
KAAQLITGPDAILNEIYMTAHMRKVTRRKEAEMAALNKLADKEVDTDEKREMLASVGLIMPHLDSTLQRFEEAGLGKYVLPDVQKRYMLRLGKLTAKINRERVLKRELEEAGLEGPKHTNADPESNRSKKRRAHQERLAKAKARASRPSTPSHIVPKAPSGIVPSPFVVSPSPSAFESPTTTLSTT